MEDKNMDIAGGNAEDPDVNTIQERNQSVHGIENVFMESDLDFHTVLKIVENMCSKLSESGEEYVMVTTNPFKQTSNYVGSYQGREFIKKNTEVLQKFVQHCYNAALDVEPMKNDEPIEGTQSVDTNENEYGPQVTSAVTYNQITNAEFSDISEPNGFESDVTENYEVEDILQKSVDLEEQKVHEQIKSNSLKNEDVSPEILLKEYPHPKKRLTRMKFNDESVYDVLSSSQTKVKLENQNQESNYTCKTCGFTCLSRTVLTKHEKRKHGSNKYKCKVCSKQCNSEKLAEKHCEQPNEEYITQKGENQNVIKDQRKSHRLRMTKQQKRNSYFKCNHCSKVFYSENTYKNHSIFHETQKYQCSDCNKSFYLKCHLLKHMKKIHNCKVDASSVFSKTHDSKVTEDGKYVCDICEKVFRKQRGLATHKKLHSVKYTSSNICEICNKCYRTRNSLTKHKKFVHTESRDFMCDFCGKGFKQQDTLNAHLITHDKNRTSFRCKECDKCLSSLSALRVHAKTHQNLKPFMCDVCGCSFSQRGNLAKHMISHTDKTTFKCGECGKSFKYHETWKTHMRSHALKAGKGDQQVSVYGKFYQCDLCSKKFPSASQHKVHLRTHTNERPYPCKTCGKCFKERGKLSRHEKIHNRSEHNEHNYIFNNKSGKNRKKESPGLANIAMKPDFPHAQVYSNEGGLLIKSVVPNTNPSSDNSQPNNHVLGHVSETSQNGETNSMVIVTEIPQIRLIDDSRHQFLMQQLTPLTNLVMEPTDGRQIHVPSSSGEIQLMHVGIVNEVHGTGANHTSQSEFPAVANVDSTSAISLHSYSKYL